MVAGIQEDAWDPLRPSGAVAGRAGAHTEDPSPSRDLRRSRVSGFTSRPRAVPVRSPRGPRALGRPVLPRDADAERALSRPRYRDGQRHRAVLGPGSRRHRRGRAGGWRHPVQAQSE